MNKHLDHAQRMTRQIDDRVLVGKDIKPKGLKRRVLIPQSPLLSEIILEDRTS